MNICIITGSTLGGAEYVGDHLADLLQAQGHKVRIENQADFDEVCDEKLWLMVSSTHGAGELPDNLKPFFEQIEQQSPDFSDLRYAVVGLGNMDYDLFCNAVNHIEQGLSRQGAQKICDSLRINVLESDPEQTAEDWLPTFTTAL